MPWKRIAVAFILWTCMAGAARSTECSPSPAKELNLDAGSSRALASPDRRWKLVSVPSSSSEYRAALYIQREHNYKRWSIGWIERSGTAFWSEDSKRLFLRDEYAADDTKIRVFDLTGASPKEIKGLNNRIQSSIFARIPKNKTTLWLYYPKVCFAANDSSTIIVVADAPLVPKFESGSGKPFGLSLTVNLNTLEVVDSTAGNSSPSSGLESAGPVSSPADWRRVDAGPFSILAPSGWEFHQLEGIDSYVGEFVGDSVILKFDFGRYSCPLKEEMKPDYIITHKSIGGHRAKIVSPRIPGHGITGVYFRNVGDAAALALFGHDLTSTQQELALKIFGTLRFGGPVPQYLLPPPPPAPKSTD